MSAWGTGLIPSRRRPVELEAQSAIAPLAARRGLGWNLLERERERENKIRSQPKTHREPVGPLWCVPSDAALQRRRRLSPSAPSVGRYKHKEKPQYSFFRNCSNATIQQFSWYCKFFSSFQQCNNGKGHIVFLGEPIAMPGWRPSSVRCPYWSVSQKSLRESLRKWHSKQHGLVRSDVSFGFVILAIWRPFLGRNWSIYAVFQLWTSFSQKLFSNFFSHGDANCTPGRKSGVYGISDRSASASASGDTFLCALYRSQIWTDCFHIWYGRRLWQDLNAYCFWARSEIQDGRRRPFCKKNKDLRFSF